MNYSIDDNIRERKELMHKLSDIDTDLCSMVLTLDSIPAKSDDFFEERKLLETARDALQALRKLQRAAISDLQVQRIHAD